MGHNTKTWRTLVSFSLLITSLSEEEKKSKYQYYHTVLCPRMKGKYSTPVTGSEWCCGKGTTWDLGCLDSFLSMNQSMQLSHGVLLVTSLENKRCSCIAILQLWASVSF